MNGSHLATDSVRVEQEQQELVDWTTFCIEGVLLPVLAIFGILGNILCVWAFNKKDVELKPSFANLLKCLSVFDTVFLTCILLQYSLPSLSDAYLTWLLPHITPYILPIIHITLTGSVYTVVAVAIERFLTVCFPFKQCHMCNGLGYILPIIAFSILYNTTKFFEIETIYLEHKDWQMDSNGTIIFTLWWVKRFLSQVVIYPWLNATELRQDPAYAKYVVFILNFVVMGLVPVVMLAVLNFFIYRSISRATATHNNISSAHRRDGTMARLLMAIVVVFLCCHSTKIIVNFYEAVQMVQYGRLEEHPAWVMILVKVNHVLLTINSATNIVIYSYKDFKFRTVIVSAFQRKRNFTSFRTSVRSSFGSSRYHTSRSQIRKNGGSSVGHNSNSDQVRTAETSLKENSVGSRGEERIQEEHQAGDSLLLDCPGQPC